MLSEEDRDAARLEKLAALLEQAPSSPIGDTLSAALQVFEQLEHPMARRIAEEALRGLRVFASRAQLDTLLFASPPSLPRELTDIEFVQLVRIEMTIHELCYCCEMIQHSTDLTSGGSSSTRFYLNGFYHYTSSLFLVDTSKPTHKNLPMGGTVIRALQPMGIADLLKPVKSILDEQFGTISFGQTILNLRHSDLVHGDFSPERVEYLISQTQFRDPDQQELFAHLIWQFFHRLILLDLNLLALIASSGKDFGVVMMNYLRSKKLI